MLLKQHHKIILVVSVLLTAGCFVHDYLYDLPGTPYAIDEIVSDILWGGSIYFALFFGIISAIFFVFNKIVRKHPG